MPKESGENFLSINQDQEQENLKLLERIKLLIRRISGKPNLEVTTKVNFQIKLQMASTGKDAGKEWFAILPSVLPGSKKRRKESVHVPKYILGEGENVAKGKAAHEAGHIAISRHGEFIPDEVMHELGFTAMIEGLEERPTDQVVRDRFSGAGLWVDEARHASLKKGKLDATSLKTLGHIPKFAQFCSLLVYHPHHHTIPDYFDKTVISLYEKLKSYVEKVEHTLPEEGASEEDVIEHAKERYVIAYRHIWPEVQKLVEKDKKDEELRKMAEKMQEDSSDSPLDQLPKKLKQELDQAKKEGEKRKEESKNKTNEIEENGSGKIAEEPPLQEEGGKKPQPIAMDTISEELREALEEIFNQLPEDVKEEIRREAQEILEAIEDEIQEQLSAKLTEDKPENHVEYAERKKKGEKTKERNREAKRERTKIEVELKDIEKRQAELQASADIYDKTYQEIHAIEEPLYRDLEEMFTPNVKRTMRLKSSGIKLNLPAIFKWKSAKKAGGKVIDNKIFESVHLPEKKDYTFTILVDLSNSMFERNKIAETFKGVVLFAEVLNRLGIKFRIVGFHDFLVEFKKFEEELTREIREKLSGMLFEPAKGYYTNTGEALIAVSKEHERAGGKEKFLVVITDGVPYSQNKSVVVMREEAYKAIEIILRETSQKLIGVGLGQGTKFVKDLFPVSIADVTVEDFAKVIGELLEDMIQYPEKYAYNPNE